MCAFILKLTSPDPLGFEGLFETGSYYVLQGALNLTKLSFSEKLAEFVFLLACLFYGFFSFFSTEDGPRGILQLSCDLCFISLCL